jgi:hypothetical protein
MEQCGCVIRHKNNSVSVKLCGAHGYGTEMLPVLRRFMQIFSELEEQYRQQLIAAYTDTLQEARAILRKVEDSQDGRREATDEHPLAATHNVMAPKRHIPGARVTRGLAKKLA